MIKEESQQKTDIVFTEVAAIYGAQETSWQSTAWVSVSRPSSFHPKFQPKVSTQGHTDEIQTTIAFGIWGGIVTIGPLVPIIKHVRIQVIVLMSVSVAFLGALSTANSTNFHRSAAFSFLATFPAGLLELMPTMLVQMESNDADLGTVVGMYISMR